jgi:hypothetical protein
MKLAALLLALVAFLGAILAIAGSRKLRRRDTPAVRRRIESFFARKDKAKPLDPGHYYRRYWS